MASFRSTTTTTLGLISLLGLYSLPAAATCDEDIAAVEKILTDREVTTGNPKSPRARQLLVARRLLEDAKDARDNKKKKRCVSKAAAAMGKIPE